MPFICTTFLYSKIIFFKFLKKLKFFYKLPPIRLYLHYYYYICLNFPVLAAAPDNLQLSRHPFFPTFLYSTHLSGLLLPSLLTLLPPPNLLLCPYLYAPVIFLPVYIYNSSSCGTQMISWPFK